MVTRGLVIALALCASLATPAAAATGLGRVAQDAGGACAAGTNHLQVGTAAGRPSYVAPHRGVLVAWTARAGGAASSVRLQVWRAVDTRYGLVATTATHEVPAGQPSTFATRIPVEAGDRLGLYVPAAGFPCTFASDDASDTTASATFTDPPAGRILTFGAAQPSRALNVSAILEPDADRDAFGDETQDRCVGVASQADRDGDGVGDACDPDPGPDPGGGAPRDPLVVQTTTVTTPTPDRLRAWFGTSAIRARPGRRIRVAFISSDAAPARIDIRRGNRLVRRVRRQVRAGRTTVTVRVPRRPGRYVLTLLVRTGMDRKATDRVPLRVRAPR